VFRDRSSVKLPRRKKARSAPANAKSGPAKGKAPGRKPAAAARVRKSR
jgi:hypothetical protein